MTATFTPAITGISRSSTKRLKWGTYLCAGGSTGGDIDVGARQVEFIMLAIKASSVVATGSSVDETLPAAVKPTIVTPSNQGGYWLALSKP